jgi:hypothetical protein
MVEPIGPRGYDHGPHGVDPIGIFRVDDHTPSTDWWYPPLPVLHLHDTRLYGTGLARQDHVHGSRERPPLRRPDRGTKEASTTIHVLTVSDLQASSFPPLSNMQPLYKQNGP